ncbi:hypothetical protein L1987_64119 [Smallanthus sonchifolius]|uniref:Uncharacterized protein n=1 Tax=Smallanthus sonchifolius TaxID=185202 RepID=A0ACB9CF60_9ASTR|nr:hypothetical protein L1987_64119 [Smallanthus sonchifolius]
MIAFALKFDVYLLLFQSRSSPYQSEKLEMAKNGKKKKAQSDQEVSHLRKEKKRRWVFGRHKLKRLTSQSTLVERPKSSEKVKPEGFLVVQEIDEPKQVLDGDIGVKEGEYCAAIKIQTGFQGFLVENDELSDEIWSLMKDYLEVEDAFYIGLAS